MKIQKAASDISSDTAYPVSYVMIVLYYISYNTKPYQKYDTDRKYSCLQAVHLPLSIPDIARYVGCKDDCEKWR